MGYVKERLDVTDDDRAEIARQVEQGYTSGIIDRDGVRIRWSLDIETFER